jgi:hypothetical protein
MRKNRSSHLISIKQKRITDYFQFKYNKVDNFNIPTEKKDKRKKRIKKEEIQNVYDLEIWDKIFIKKELKDEKMNSTKMEDDESIIGKSEDVININEVIYIKEDE